MGSLMTIFNEQHNSLAAATRVLQAIAWRQHLTCCKGLWPDDFKGLEELLDVTFSYQTRPETPVPCHINLTLLPGTVTALVRCWHLLLAYVHGVVYCEEALSGYLAFCDSFTALTFCADGRHSNGPGTG